MAWELTSLVAGRVEALLPPVNGQPGFGHVLAGLTLAVLLDNVVGGTTLCGDLPCPDHEGVVALTVMPAARRHCYVKSGLRSGHDLR
jgi:hypothetical protein